MKPCHHGSTRSFLFAILLLCFTVSAEAAASRDVLWDIVGKCLDPGVADYCAKCPSPRIETSCAAELLCKQTTEVWAETAEFVAIRDRKTCSCPTDFVHGLAIPRTRVAGVEDPRRPNGIWNFAWATAMKKMPNDQAAALAVNPAGNRAQDQLHVHILRLRPEAQQLIKASRTARIDNLDKVWETAGKMAAAAGLSDYGVLVTRHPEGGFMVLVDKASPEKKYTLERCR